MSLTIDKAYLQILASQLDGPIVFDQREMSIAVLSLPPGVSGFDVLKSHVVSGDSLQDLLLRCGYRIIEQRFPRRAYVVIRDEHAPQYVQDLEVNNTGMIPRVLSPAAQ